MKLKQLFESMPTSKQEVEAILNRYDITNYIINNDLSVDVDGDVNLYNQNLTNIPAKFGNVSGYFDCSYNQLSSLRGALREVGGGFYCTSNKLTSLEGSPREVGGNFWCNKNSLASLKGAPREVGGNFDCSDNKITALYGIGHVGGQIISDLT